MSIKEEIQAYLDKSMTKFEKVVNNIKEEDLTVQIQDKDGGWSVIEVLRHIQNSEPGMSYHIKSIIAGNEGASSDFDLQRYNTSSNEKMQNMSLDQVKENMIKHRENTIKILETVKEEDWTKEGRHPNLGNYSIKVFFEIISWHQQNHLKAIREKFNL
ncbi:MAG: DinB family protein [Candidatus Heimdallarchaeota archaeon]|nr:DinB family protein [Candidatus Heimdallarchaeota archaeon]